MGGCASQCLLFALEYTAFDMRRRLVLADWSMGAALIAAMVAAFIDSGMGVGPLSWDGQAGEKWSFTFAQKGHIIQCDFAELGWRAGGGALSWVLE